MMAAMAADGGLCIFIGCYTPYLYLMLPYPVEYHPYTAYHISETLQILLFTALGFFLLLKKLTPRRRSVSISTGFTARAARPSFGSPAVPCSGSTRGLANCTGWRDCFLSC
jgi:hypothetical protein